MKNASKKQLSFLLAAALILSLFAAMPITVCAHNASALAEIINYFNHGGTGTLNAAVTGNIVTVTGSVTDPLYTLELNIDPGVTVTWKAAYSASELSFNTRYGAFNVTGPQELIKLTGGGVFDVAEGGSVINKRNKGDAILADGINSTVVVSGGAVQAAGESNAICLNADYNAVTVRGGTVESTGATAIYAPKANAKINIEGGVVHYSGERGWAVHSAKSSTIVVSGGVVSCDSPIGKAIFSEGGNTSIEIKSGVINGAGGYGGETIQSRGDGSYIQMSGGLVNNSTVEGIGITVGGYKSTLRISGGAVTTDRGRSIYCPASDCGVYVYGNGKVHSSNGMAICADIGGNNIVSVSENASVTGGESATAIFATCSGAKVSISGGAVYTLGAEAVYTGAANASVTINGGFVFSTGADIIGRFNVIYMENGSPAIEGSPVVCAWNAKNGVNAAQYSYTVGTSEDLKAAPAGAAARWDKAGNDSGIRYANGSTTGWFVIGNVTAAPPGQAAPPAPVPAPTPAPSDSQTPAPTPPPGQPSKPTPKPTVKPSPKLTPKPGLSPGLSAKNGDAWSKASEWAIDELRKAAAFGLIPDTFDGKDFTKPINRAEFAAVCVKVYESMSGVEAAPANPNPFTDTDDVYVLKALNIGLTAGTSATTFEPDLLLNREQAAAMLTRVYKYFAYDDWSLEADGDFPLIYTKQAPFDDDAKISGWARDSVYFMASKGIINGIGNNLFAPRNTTPEEEASFYANATIEQALLIAARMISKLGAI